MSPLSPSTETKLRRGVRDLLAGLDLGCPVVAGVLKPSTTDAVVGVVTYETGDPSVEASTGQTTVSVQLTIRGDAASGSDPLSDRRQAIRDALTWIGPRTVGGVVVSSAFRQLISGPPALDEQSRPVLFDTFDLTCSRVGAVAPVHSI
ncbi:hypothetical protein FDO65_10105 [Nakamurella flava]|uniref:DUF3168 domain-containing protein n=1 Tax=Nakamurella flava TaxID=2576308 RepID=A0A4U6QMG6_9ACTN|nr:hypothetical protein [Nakamurella flava]TKV61867.1 hypothetical protein FDO65_10105 [Nakamurella flava]